VQALRTKGLSCGGLAPEPKAGRDGDDDGGGGVFSRSRHPAPGARRPSPGVLSQHRAVSMARPFRLPPLQVVAAPLPELCSELADSSLWPAPQQPGLERAAAAGRAARVCEQPASARGRRSLARRQQARGHRQTTAAGVAS